MFGLSWAQIIIIVVVGMAVLGPERIPTAVQWVGSSLKKVRTMAAGAQEQLRGEFGPEIDELRRQIADLQSLKEIQELRNLRDLNPRNMLTKNLLGEEFSGGIGGFLGLNGNGPDRSTGSGVAAEVGPVNEPAVIPVTTNPAVVPVTTNTDDAGSGVPSAAPFSLSKDDPAPAAADDDSGAPGPQVVAMPPIDTSPTAPRHAASEPVAQVAFDTDAT